MSTNAQNIWQTMDHSGIMLSPLCSLCPPVPSCGPTNVSAFATTSSSILVRWFEVPEPDRNGLILGYKVCSCFLLFIYPAGERPPITFLEMSFLGSIQSSRVTVSEANFSLSPVSWLVQVVYKEKDSDSAVHFWTVEGNATHSVQLTGLGKYVLYEIQVLAFTRIGDGRPSSPFILERTLDDVPGPPVGILFPEVRTTSVRLIWQSPSQPNGIILG